MKGQRMRLIISSLAVAVLVTGVAALSGAAAQESRKYRSYDRYEYDRDRDYRAFRRLVPGYEARNPDNFRSGSDTWWKAMDKEGRGGHRRL